MWRRKRYYAVGATGVASPLREGRMKGMRVIVIGLLAVTFDATAQDTLQSLLNRPEAYQRKSLSDTAGRLFWNEEFERLEAMFAQVRDQDWRTASGVPMLSYLYKGIEELKRHYGLRSEQDWNDVEARASRWLELMPASVSAQLAYATVLRQRAWYYRGGGYAYKVSRRQFARFHRQVEVAKRYLLERPLLAAADPHWYVLMLYLIKEQSRPDGRLFGLLLDQAITSHPRYYDIYFAGVAYFMPKWHGSAAHVEAFAREVLDKAPPEHGHVLYTRIYWSVSGSQYEDGSLFLASAARWNLMRAGFEQIIAEYPSAWNLNHFAKFACLAEDRPTAQRLFDRIGNNVVPTAWSEREDLFKRCEGWLGRIAA
jgi:hypothetical protein